jgi:hypothetical protein
MRSELIQRRALVGEPDGLVEVFCRVGTAHRPLSI